MKTHSAVYAFFLQIIWETQDVAPDRHPTRPGLVPIPFQPLFGMQLGSNRSIESNRPAGLLCGICRDLSVRLGSCSNISFVNDTVTVDSRQREDLFDNCQVPLNATFLGSLTDSRQCFLFFSSQVNGQPQSAINGALSTLYCPDQSAKEYGNWR